MKRGGELTRRTPLKQGSAPMKRTPMPRGASTLKSTKPLARAQAPMKTSRPKMTPIRKSAQGQPCTLRIPGVCRNQVDTVVWCHENSYAAGKGMGLKAKDEHGAYGCAHCHAVYDGQAPRPPGLTREDIEVYFARGKHVSRLILQQKGLLE